VNFDDLDQKMRIYETAHDHCVMPNLYIVARLDGRTFTRLTKEVHQFESPFDVRFRDMMLDTVEHLMNCGFPVVYGFTQSDEISLLFSRSIETFKRKERKFNSILAGEASAKFSIMLGAIGVFDCRICQLPSAKEVVDYFRWRQEDAHRNALNAHCYWLLRKQGQSVNAATQALMGLSVADKNELLFQNGINFNDLPAWQKRGMGIYWETFIKDGYNPIKGETVQTERRRLYRDLELKYHEGYEEFISTLLSQSEVA
jgi:tRNA(His) 5'-end guanylyltransferase